MIALTDYFIESVQKYLTAVQPQYNGERFEIRERELQAFFLGRLIESGHNVRAEGTYPDSAKRYDLLLQPGTGYATYIEIEWDANWTDGFRKRTFDDLEKLCKLTPIGSCAAFFAVNISNKWKPGSFSKEQKTVYDPTELPVSAGSINQTALGRYWHHPERDSVAPLLKHGLQLTYWEYDFAPKHNVLILACHGRRIPKRSGSTWSKSKLD
jgi:hypothetical protein